MNIVFNSSLPRSGSTLLQNLMAQCPKNHCTPTSDVIELLVQVRNSYSKMEGFRSQGTMNVSRKIANAMRGLLQGYYSEELHAGKTIWEKSRGWLAYIELMEEVLLQRTKVVCCVRDVREIVASFERLYRTNQLTRADVQGDAYFEAQTIEGRVEHLLQPGAVVGLAIARLTDAIDRKLGDRIYIIRYNDLVADPIGTVMTLATTTGTTPFMCDPSNVKQMTVEDDSVHGMSLHKVRSTVDTNGSTIWQDYLPERIGFMLHKRFPHIQSLAGVPD